MPIEIKQEAINNDVKFTIRASEHPQTDPRTKDYEIPIYITASEKIFRTVIEKLVIEIDKNIFHPRNSPHPASNPI